MIWQTWPIIVMIIVAIGIAWAHNCYHMSVLRARKLRLEISAAWRKSIGYPWLEFDNDRQSWVVKKDVLGDEKQLGEFTSERSAKEFLQWYDDTLA